MNNSCAWFRLGRWSLLLALLALDVPCGPAQAANGASGLAPLLVVNTNDSGPGSLRAALTNAATMPGADTITFDPALDGQSISLGSQITVNDTNGVTIDATSLPGGLTFNDGINTTFRLFEIVSGTSLTLHGLRLANGGGSSFNGVSRLGGAILNRGMLTLTRCTLSGNSSGNGGAIYNTGSLALMYCNLSGNSAGSGGALYNTGSLTLMQCVLSGNFLRGGGGGAVYNEGTLTLMHCAFAGNRAHADAGAFAAAILNERTATLTRCTFVGNSADDTAVIYNRSGDNHSPGGTLTLTHCTLSGNFAYSKGAIFNRGTLTLNHSIVAGTTVPGGGISTDIFNGGFLSNSTLTREGANIIQLIYNFPNGTESGPAAITNAPLLAPLGDYGGPTLTMALLPGSPARNAALGSTHTTDQRGFPVVGIPDIGAYEAGTLSSNFNAYIWETLPTTNAAAHDPAFDFDLDGVSNYDEWLALIDHSTGANPLRATIVPDGANALITFPTTTGLSYTLHHADTLPGPWTDTGLSPVAGNGSPRTFTITPTNPPLRFFRIQANPL